MCGINGFITLKKPDNYKNILKNIEHRGPDDKSLIEFTIDNYNVCLSFYRLSIIDIENGMQPFIYKNEKRSIYLLCNGEIYNYKKLIEKYKLATKSDCHVILDLYLIKEDITNTIKELDGEFAFILIDIKHEDGNNNITTYFGRDRFGIRPLFYNFDNNGLYFSSELKGLVCKKGEQVTPRRIYRCVNMVTLIEDNRYEYYNLNNIKLQELPYRTILKKINYFLKQSVKDRMQSERPLGCLLSGGLDSSLIAGIASQFLKEKGERLRTFCIGMDKDSPDIEYARKVASHINSIHHEIIIPVQKWIEILPKLIKQIETYDITTIRATCGQYLLAKWISENTDIKVLLNGDGSDELTSGYLYFYNSPDKNASHQENIRLLNNIHIYDVLRVDRGISAFGLEARVPFLSHNFVNFYLSIDPAYRFPFKNAKSERIEKSLLRYAFEDDNIIPLEVLMRKKEAFSDGVSNIKKSWFEYIKEYVDTEITDEEYNENNKQKIFPSKEAYWYKKIYDNFYYESEQEIKYWMPKWTEENYGDPSARKLKVYLNNFQ